MIRFPLVIAVSERDMPGIETGPLGWHTSALTNELQEYVTVCPSFKSETVCLKFEYETVCPQFEYETVCTQIKCGTFCFQFRYETNCPQFE